MENKIEIKKEIDGDYGPILRAYIWGNRTHYVILESAEDAEMTLLKSIIIRQQDVIDRQINKLSTINSFRLSLKEFLGSI